MSDAIQFIAHRVVELAFWLFLALAVRTMILAIAGWCVAWRLTHPRRRNSRLAIISIRQGAQEDAVELPRTSETTAPGTYGLWFNDGPSHVRVGDVVGESPSTVTRARLTSHGEPPRTGQVFQWSRVAYAHPEDLSLPVTSFSPTPGAPPAWHVPAENPTSTRWAIHIHGLGSTAAATLASFPTFHAADYHSLAMTYGDPRCTTLGQEESGEVERLVEHAVQHGATSIILVGWSMGAAVARLLIGSSRHASLIHGALLIAPMLDWRTTVEFAARVTRIPRFAARAGLAVVEHPLFSRTVGLRRPIDIDAMSWFGGVPVNVLTLHSPEDRTTPYAASAALAAENPERVTLCSLAAPIHTTEWNVDPAACSDASSAWLRQLKTATKPSMAP